MPWKKKQAKRRGRRRRKYAVTQFVRQPVIADKTIVKLRYHESTSINPLTGSSLSHFWSANSIYDPNATGTGHKVMGYDQWEPFYAHYTVLGSKLTARFCSGVDDGTGICLVGVGLQRDTTGTIDPNTVIERRDANTRLLTSANAMQTVTVVKCFSARKFFGYKDVGEGDETRTAMGSNPQDRAYFNTFISSLSGNDPTTTFVSVTIDYIVQFSERKDLTGS